MKKVIKPELYQKLVKLNDKKLALDKFMKSMIAEGQRSMQEFDSEVRQVWNEIAKDEGIDLSTTDWAPDQKEPNTIVLLQQRFYATQQK